MAASLKSLIPHLARWLGMKPAAIYERQRALVRAGLLKARSGRGPGSGVQATPDSVAMLLISLIATASLSEVEAATRATAKLRNRKGKCPLTGKKDFASALTANLTTEELARRAFSAGVMSGGNRRFAEILFEPVGRLPERDNDSSLIPMLVSRFGDQHARARMTTKISMILPSGVLLEANK